VLDGATVVASSAESSLPQAAVKARVVKAMSAVRNREGRVMPTIMAAPDREMETLPYIIWMARQSRS
jgi:hypothetical protein